MESVHILLVEDNEGDVLLTTEALEERRISNKISVVRDGKQAIDFLNQKAQYAEAELPGIVLLDINLPKKNGHEVLESIRSSARLKHIPVIILTTSSSEKDVNEAYKNYANGFLTKPIEVDDFLSAMLKMEEFSISIVRSGSKNI